MSIIQHLDDRCTVCGQGGYWVGWSSEHGQYRCVNHLDTPTPEGDPDAQ